MMWKALVSWSNRNMKSSHSVRSFNIGVDTGGDQKFRAAMEHRSRNSKTTEASFDQEYPPLSASICVEPKRKRRARLELGTDAKEKPDQASFAMSNPKDSYLPTGFGNECELSDSKSPKLPRNTMFPPASSSQQPFDICIQKATKQNPCKGSSHKMWVPKEQRYVAKSVEENGQVLRPGMVLLKKYIPISEQVNIVNKCRELGLGPSGFYRPGYKDGAKLRLFMMCLGLDWDPQTRAYAQIRRHDSVVPPCIPSHFSSLVANSLEDSHRLIIKEYLDITNVDDMLPKMSPDLCIVNFYTTNGRLGLHQDRDETDDSLQKGLPVVSMSIGDSAEFLYGDQRDVDKADSLLLESGDVLIFGGKSRHIFHGVTNIFPRTAPPELLEKTGLRPGRLNLTFRKH